MIFGYFDGSVPSLCGNDYNDPQAPWNQPEPLYETCPNCEGDGGIYYNDEGAELSVVDYERLSEEDKALWTFDKCERCDGIGTIITEPYEPDYDDYY